MCAHPVQSRSTRGADRSGYPTWPTSRAGWLSSSLERRRPVPVTGPFSADELAEEARRPRSTSLTLMEMLEPCPDPDNPVQPARAGGCRRLVFFSTITRQLAGLPDGAIVGPNTCWACFSAGRAHDYARFILPSDLARQPRDSGLQVEEELARDFVSSRLAGRTPSWARTNAA